MSSVAVFWDRDNTLIKDPGYISEPGQVELLPGAAEALKRLAAAGFENIIVTNQSGIARGYFDEAALARVHDRMVALLAEQGAKIDAIYFCPYLAGPEARVEKYRKDSEWRKPKPGMILQAALERKLELAGSWTVGDGLHDVQAGRAAGCRTILIRRPGVPATARKGGDVDFLVDSLEQAAATVLKYTRHAVPIQPPAPAPPTRRESAPPVLAPSAKRGVEPELAPSAKREIELTPEPPAPPPAPVTRPPSPDPEIKAPPEPAAEPTPTVRPGVEEPTEPRIIMSPDEPTTRVKPEVEKIPEPLAPELTPPEPPPSAPRAAETPNPLSYARKNPQAHMPTDTVALLQEILTFLRMADRRARADEFALGKLLGAIAQIAAIGALTWSIFGQIREEPIEARLGFAILFQLMALTCFVFSPRK